MIDGEYTTQGWNRYSYCKGNPVKYKDPTGHNTISADHSEGSKGPEPSDTDTSTDADSSDSTGSGGDIAQALSDTVERVGNAVTGNGFKTNNQVIENKISHNKATVADVQKYIKNKTGKEHDLTKGFHAVVLKDFFEKDTSIKPYQKKQGGYLAYGPNGEDKFRDKMLIIDDGKITLNSAARTEASVVPGTHPTKGFRLNKNAGNNLLPGDYKVKGSSSYGRSLQIYASEEKMNNGDRRVDSTLGPNRQRNLLIHSAYGNKSVYSGSTGCTVARDFKGWSRDQYSSKDWSKIKGDYHLVDTSH